MILNDVYRKSIKHSSVWCRGNLKRHIYSIQKFKATRFIMCDSHFPALQLCFFFFKEHTNRWRYIFPISALTAASTLFVRASIMLNSLVLLRRGHVQHQPAPLRGRRTNTGATGAALRFSWRRSEFAVQTSRRLLQDFGWFRERKKTNKKITQNHSGGVERLRALEYHDFRSR